MDFAAAGRWDAGARVPEAPPPQAPPSGRALGPAPFCPKDQQELNLEELRPPLGPLAGRSQSSWRVLGVARCPLGRPPGAGAPRGGCEAGRRLPGRVGALAQSLFPPEGPAAERLVMLR